MNCNVRTIFAIRDNASRLGLTTQEVVFLFTVESHGESTATAQTLASEMRISRATFYRVRDRLVSRGLIRAVTRGRSTTVYRVDAEALSLSEHAHSETLESHSETGLSLSETETSHCEHTEENKKKTEENKKSAPTPVLTSSMEIPSGGSASEASHSPAVTVSLPRQGSSLDGFLSGIEEAKRERSEHDAENAARLAEREAFRAAYRDKEAAYQRGDITLEEFESFQRGIF